MKQYQLDIFGESPAKKKIADGDVTKRRRRKAREAKKAPMLVDAYVGEDQRPKTTDQRPKTRDQRLEKDEGRRVLTVSEITERIKAKIEPSFSDVWVSGEVTDFRNRAGRHYYFALKDESSRLRAVIFGAGDNHRVPFELKDGMEVVCHGSLNVYPPQGSYSLIVDIIEPKGIGALQLAFEQLKEKLNTEGLFARERKRALPYLPRRIGVVTSPSGAAVRDVVHVLTRRFPNIEILLHPVRVQGDGAAAEIAEAIRVMNSVAGLDLLIVGRGGGSIEDLWAFNEEVVARAIAASKLPVISAVGHEIDFTIADFVADVRAATPSAAAEIAVPVRGELVAAISERRRRLSIALEQAAARHGAELMRLAGRLGDPRKRFPDLLLRVDGFKERLAFAKDAILDRHGQRLLKLMSNLDHLSPLGVLAKGYAVAQRAVSGETIRSSKMLKQGDELKLTFHEGAALAGVLQVLGQKIN